MTHHPCRQDCPRRSSECHSICPDWATYERERNAAYDAKIAARGADEVFFGGKERRKVRNWRRTGEWHVP